MAEHCARKGQRRIISPPPSLRLSPHLLALPVQQTKATHLMDRYPSEDGVAAIFLHLAPLPCMPTTYGTLSEWSSGNYKFLNLVTFHLNWFSTLSRPVHPSLSDWSCVSLAVLTQITWSSKWKISALSFRSKSKHKQPSFSFSPSFLSSYSKSHYLTFFF